LAALSDERLVRRTAAAGPAQRAVRPEEPTQALIRAVIVDPGSVGS
jgi:hypothetical protein